jgi:hypothetical protein
MSDSRAVMTRHERPLRLGFPGRQWVVVAEQPDEATGEHPAVGEACDEGAQRTAQIFWIGRGLARSRITLPLVITAR